MGKNSKIEETIMKISELAVGAKLYTQLGSRVLAVLSRREEGWAMYVGAVRGQNHDLEWEEVARSGDKQKESIARAIAADLFYPGFDPGDLPYVS